MRKADHTKIPLESLIFALGVTIGVAVSVLGETRLIPPIGTTQPVADSLYVNVTGDTVTGDFAVQGNTTLGDGVEDYVSFKADYIECLNPTIFDLAYGATFDGSGIPLVWKATQCDFQNGGKIIAPDGSITAPGFAFNDGGDVYDTGWWNSASKGNCLLHASVDATEVINIDVATTTVKNDLNVDGSAVLGDAVGDSITFRGGTWTSQEALTWHIDGTTTFNASGETVSLDGAWGMANDAYFARDVNAGLTASTNQSQGQGALTAEINEVATCANNNDVVTLPTAVTGRHVMVINNGAKTLQIFPASSDDLGAGVDSSTTLSSGNNVTYQAYGATNWESM